MNVHQGEPPDALHRVLRMTLKTRHPPDIIVTTSSLERCKLLVADADFDTC